MRGAADEELVFEAVVPMGREALVGSIMRRVGAKGAANGFWRRGEIGPIAAWKTENGFQFRRSGLFSMPVWITLDARVDDVGAASCRVHGRVGWDSKLASERRFRWSIPLIIVGCGVAGVVAELGWVMPPPAFILLILGLLVLPLASLYRQFYAPAVRRRAPEHRRFLVEWLERLIDAPVTVRAVRRGP
jgi:hypothetical protein